MDKRLFLLFVLSFLLVSCNQSQEVITSKTLEIPNKTENRDQIQTPEPAPSITPVVTITSKPTDHITPSKDILETQIPDDPTTDHCPNELYEDSSSQQQKLPGNIYLWNPYPENYYMYNPGIGLSSMQEINPIKADIPGPNIGFAPSFSTYSEKIAYLVTNSDGFIELWVADSNLCQVERIWEDNEQWLGDAIEYSWDNQAYIIWGPSDNTIIVVSRVNRPHYIIHSFTSGELFMWSGGCDQIIRNQEFDYWTTACSFEFNGVINYAILGLNGSINKIPSLPDNDVISVSDWAFSPDQSQVIFSSQDNKLYVAQGNGASIQLPIFWNDKLLNQFHFDIRKQIFDWSLDSDYILVFGYEESGEMCPVGVSIATGSKFNQPCWFLVNAQSGEIFWWLKKEIIEQILPWEGLFTYYEATLSPDNGWIAMFVMHPPIRSAILVNFETGEMKEIGNFIGTKIHWGD